MPTKTMNVLKRFILCRSHFDPRAEAVQSDNSLVPIQANNKPTKDSSLGLIFPGECFELKTDIQNIFNKEFTKCCNSSKSLKDFSKLLPLNFNLNRSTQ